MMIKQQMRTQVFVIPEVPVLITSFPLIVSQMLQPSS